MNNYPEDIKNSIAWIVIIALLLSGLAASFYHGYFRDDSKPVSGIGWADQSYYHNVSKKIATGERLGKQDFHYQMGYPLLGAAFLYLGVNEPYAYVSFLLMMASAIFLILGAKQHFTKYFVALFIVLVFFRLGDVRKLEYASEIFMIPWNNQVLFLCVSLYFYEFSRPIDEKYKLIRLTVVGLVTGWTIGAREESVLFLLPLLACYLCKISASWRQAVYVFIMVAIAYSPNIIFKYLTFGVVFENVRLTDQGVGYVEKLRSYLHYSRLIDNIVDLVVNSSLRGLDSGGRRAILQANPWFWISPLGFILLIARANKWIIIYVSLILAMFVFYLSGENMNIQKLRFHCLRYVSFSWIIFSFMTIYFVDYMIKKYAMTVKLNLNRISGT